jgi:hemoglobin-like flavoprotein
MDARNIELLAASFARVSANKSDAATLFYARLFTTAPQLRPLFRGDLEAQKHKLMSSLAQIVDFYRVGVDHQGYLARLGHSHQAYGVQRTHFDAVGDALVFTLAQVLGDDFTPDIRHAWVEAYAEVSAVMIRSAEVTPTAAPLAAAG